MAEKTLPPEILAASKAAREHQYDTSKYVIVDTDVRRCTAEINQRKESKMTCTDNLTLGEIKELMAIISNVPNTHQPFKIGKAYLIRTVTHIDIGIVKEVGDKELVLSEASWIADTGRYHDALKTGNLNEVEPYINDVILGRGSIIDATLWEKDLPRSQK